MRVLRVRAKMCEECSIDDENFLLTLVNPRCIDIIFIEKCTPKGEKGAISATMKKFEVQ